MKKSTKVLLITALVMLGVGVVMCASAFALGGVDSFVRTNGDYKVVVATFDEADSINIDTASADVDIRISTDDEVKVSYPVSDKFGYKVTCESGLLNVIFEDKREWHDYIGISFSDADERITVDLPEKIYKSVTVNTASGDIEATKAPDATSWALNCTSGDISARLKASELVVRNTSGRIDLSVDISGNTTVSSVSGAVTLGGTYGDITLTSVSGGIKAENFTASDVTMKNSSGRILLNKTQLHSLKADNVSGKVELCDTLAENNINVSVTSGFVVLDAVDAENYNIKTVSGEVKGTILSNKHFDISTTSGDVNYPKLTEASGTFVAKTTSGSIDISLAE